MATREGIINAMLAAWHNGNREAVVEQIVNMTPPHAAYYSARLVSVFYEIYVQDQVQRGQRNPVDHGATLLKLIDEHI